MQQVMCEAMYHEASERKYMYGLITNEYMADDVQGRAEPSKQLEWEGAVMYSGNHSSSIHALKCHGT